MAKPYSETWLEHLRTAKRCEWCGVGSRVMPRLGLCPHCNEIKKQLTKLRASAKKPPSAVGPLYRLQMELAIKEAERANCIVYGNVVRRILNGEVDGLSLEHQLTRISKHLSGMDLFHGDATSLGWALAGTAQGQLLAYLLWEIEGAYARKNRRRIAEGIAARKMRGGR
jgi:hypothetical protein